MVKILLHGCNGQMGKVIYALAKNDDSCEVVAGVDPGEGTTSATFPRYNDLNQCDMPADVVVDFSVAPAVDALLDYCLFKKYPVVVCTTGLYETTQEKLRQASGLIPVFQSANMSLGINLLARLIEKAAPILYDAGFDIEIVEKHHNQKVDAPSGTALLLAQAASLSAGNSEQPLPFVFDRSKQRQKRGRAEIGIQSLRGGTIVGEHTMLFAGKDEVIELTHSAHSKDIFAVGALKAAKYLKEKPPGLYTMQDMLKELF